MAIGVAAIVLVAAAAVASIVGSGIPIVVGVTAAGVASWLIVRRTTESEGSTARGKEP
jgi:hypothetical protein